MRSAWTLLLISGMALGQAAETTAPPAAPDHNSNASVAASGSSAADSNAVVIPVGSKIPLSLAQAISTKNAREGDAVYAVTAFPFVVGDRMLVPAGTYVQGKISHVERAGRVKGRAEILMHFTSMIYPSGYAVMLPGSVENMPGSENTSVKDKEGTVQRDKTTTKKVEDAAKNGAYGTVAGATAGGVATGGLNGARVGAGAGAAAGVAWALLKHGPEIQLGVGTSIEMQIERPIAVDPSRIQMARVVR